MDENKNIISQENTQDISQTQTENGQINGDIEVTDILRGERRSHHHSSHHKHHSYSKKHRKSHRRKEKNLFYKLKSFARHNKKQLGIVGIFCLVVVIALVVTSIIDNRMFNNDDEPQQTVSQNQNKTPSSLKISLPFFDEEVSLSSGAVSAYMGSDVNTSISAIYNKYTAEKSATPYTAMPVRLSFSVDEIPDGYKIERAEFIVSENSDFSNGRIYKADSENKADVYYLKTGCQYYYRLDLTLNDQSVSSHNGKFKTAHGPRVLSPEGVGNMRDIGGWETSFGKPVKQGLLYRGCEIDGAVESSYFITEKGVNDMLVVLGIKTDMDLRSSADSKQGVYVLGAGVKHTYYDAYMYTHIFTDNGKARIKNIFTDLADESNYPVYLHCTYGRDRTGTTCYLLGALLGMSEEDLKRDYQLSGLFHGSSGTTDIDNFVAKLKTYPGDNIQIKTENYLMSAGVTPQQISNIRNIFLG